MLGYLILIILDVPHGNAKELGLSFSKILYYVMICVTGVTNKKNVICTNTSNSKEMKQFMEPAKIYLIPKSNDFVCFMLLNIKFLILLYLVSIS